MRGTIAAIAVGLVGAALTGLAFFWAYDQTLTRHEDMPPGSSTWVVLEGDLRDAAEEDIGLMVDGLVSACVLEVRGRLTDEGIQRLDQRRFGLRLVPGLDDADERQLRGCLEDWRIDGLLTTVQVLQTDEGRAAS